jgi:type I restriction-modification system DNA methylase subunit
VSALAIDLVRQGLISVHYRQDRLRPNVPVPSTPSCLADLVAYADQPFDARTSTLAAVDGTAFDMGSLHLLRPLGAPVVAQCHSDHVLFWRQTPSEPIFIERVAKGKIASFFQAHREELAPNALYRAKVWSRTDESAQQLTFVDAGLLPVVEQAAGEDLRKLLERAVMTTKTALGWTKDMSEENGRWLLKAVFWLLAAKILKDKGVPGFVRGSLCDLENVYDRLAKHYNRHDPRPVQINSSKRRDALLGAAEMIQAFGHCGAVTTESLAWVYESALIDRATRQKFGTHSTPTWLIDEIISKLSPWIKEMDVDDRRVFEPACGHAGFLISAMRLLSALLPEDRASERKSYLRQRLHGIEADSFAYEVAKLSLTLADVPNDNGWMLKNDNMFIGDSLCSAISKASIVLANPPFEKFGDARPDGAMHKKADETFRQIVESLPLHGVFGIVMPQGILHSTQGKALRRKLLDEYEISEITLFADKIFNYGEPETAVILGRRVGPAKKHGTVLYRRVREEQIEAYTRTFIPSSIDEFSTQIFETQSGKFFVPEMVDIWWTKRDCPRLEDFIHGGQGFQHKGREDPTLSKDIILESDVDVHGFAKGFNSWDKHQLTHDRPKPTWLNLDPNTIGRHRHGTLIGQKQILLNYPPVSRGPWRLKALLDLNGHPVTSQFNVLRPGVEGPSVYTIWGILNSPFANAFGYAHTTKLNVQVGNIRKMPFPQQWQTSCDHLDAAVEAYLKAAQGSKALYNKSKRQAKTSNDQLSLALPGEQKDGHTPEEELKYLHWRIDAEVLRLYNLPASMERRILELFTGVQRRGVPFTQTEYFPKGFTHLDRLSDLLAITADWTHTNHRRCQLIRNEKETAELQRLESLADARIALMDILHPTAPDEITLTVERLKLEGKWQE